MKSENIYLWAFNVLKYDKLRRIPGCSGLSDLYAVKLDQAFIEQIGKVLRIPEDNLFIDSETTLAVTKKRFLEFMKKSKVLHEQKIPHLYIIYCGGHGVSSEEKQIFLLNEEDKVKAQFPIEFKFRTLSKSYGARVCCIYDCCRVAIEK